MLASDKANQALQAVESLSISDEVVQQLNSKSALPDTSIYLYQGPKLVQALQERGVTRTDELFKVQRLDDRFSLSYVRMPKLVADSCLRESTLREKDLKNILNLESEDLTTGQPTTGKRNQIRVDASSPPLSDRLRRKRAHSRV